MAKLQAHLRMVMYPSEGYKLNQEERSGAVWLVAKNYRTRFDGVLTLTDKQYHLQGVFLTVESSMLAIGTGELNGYAHGVVSVYDALALNLLFTGPFFNPLERAFFRDGQMSGYSRQIAAAWAGTGVFAGHLLRLSLPGNWQDGEDPHMLAEGTVNLTYEGEE